jgi:hypothetical protein
MSADLELLTPAGEKLLGELRGLTVTPDLALRLSASLRGLYPTSLVAAALTQQSLRIAGREKFSRADDMLFTRAGLEQASPEAVAAHSARRFAGLTDMADLCCGIGGDLLALTAVMTSACAEVGPRSTRGPVAGGTGVTASGGRNSVGGRAGAASRGGRVLAVDNDRDVLAFAMRNLAVYGRDAAVSAVCADVRDADLTGIEAVFVDPARRAGGRRLRTGDSQPPLAWCFELAGQVPRVCVKAAPGLAHELVPAGWEIEFVAVARGLKEALLWSPAFATTTRRATVLAPGGTVARVPSPQLPGALPAPAENTLVASPGLPLAVAAPGEYLLDPSPAVTRAGLVAELGRELGAWQIDPMIAFLSLDRAASTPFARTLRVLESMPWHERKVATRLRELGIGSADIRRRGLAGDVQQIHRRLALSGDQHATIVITRRDDRPWCLICAAPPDGS